MPIKNFSFHSVDGVQAAQLRLPIRIINPDTGQSVKKWGLIDTGADYCCMPAGLADPLGHTLAAGTEFTFHTGNGPASAYAHSTVIKILNHQGGLVYTIPRTQICFMLNLHIPLLGVKDFLERFKLMINYPTKRFSITRPASTQLTNG